MGYPRRKDKQQVRRRGYRVDEWCEAYRTSRAKAYELMTSGKLAYVKLGGRRFITEEAAEALLEPP
jgi:predicted site-specific integrase-resolvase